MTCKIETLEKKTFLKIFISSNFYDRTQKKIPKTAIYERNTYIESEYSTKLQQNSLTI